MNYYFMIDNFFFQSDIKMPPTPEVDFTWLEQQLKNYPGIFQKNGSQKGYTWKPRSDQIWIKIKNELNLKMQPISIYYHLYNDKYLCRTHLEKFFELKIYKRKRPLSDAANEKNFGEEGNPKGCKPLQFEVNLCFSSIVEEINRVIRNKEIIKEDLKSSLKCKISIINGYITKKNFLKENVQTVKLSLSCKVK